MGTQPAGRTTAVLGRSSVVMGAWSERHAQKSSLKLKSADVTFFMLSVRSDPAVGDADVDTRAAQLQYSPSRRR